jgi:hypothetical protein
MSPFDLAAAAQDALATAHIWLILLYAIEFEIGFCPHANVMIEFERREQHARIEKEKNKERWKKKEKERKKHDVSYKGARGEKMMRVKVESGGGLPEIASPQPQVATAQSRALGGQHLPYPIRFAHATVPHY